MEERIGFVDMRTNVIERERRIVYEWWATHVGKGTSSSGERVN